VGDFKKMNEWTKIRINEYIIDLQMASVYILPGNIQIQSTEFNLTVWDESFITDPKDRETLKTKYNHTLLDTETYERLLSYLDSICHRKFFRTDPGSIKITLTKKTYRSEPALKVIECPHCKTQYLNDDI
jgi:hypothetical protein